MATNTAKVSLPADNQVLITREFDVAPPLVWRAYTEPELIKRWWGGDRGTVTGVQVDLRVGGTWRYVMTANAGFEVAFHGTYREIGAPHRLVSTEVFEGIPDADSHAAVDTLALTEIDGRTLLEVLVEHQTQADRDAHINSGMEAGMQESYNYLEEIARTLS